MKQMSFKSEVGCCWWLLNQSVSQSISKTSIVKLVTAETTKVLISEKNLRKK